MINTKEQIIKYFESGIKKNKDFKIGIEHEKFLFSNVNNKRVDYSKVKEYGFLENIFLTMGANSSKVILLYLGSKDA